jgi:hypothetical protein
MNDSRFNKTFIIQPALGSDSYLSGTTFNNNNTIYYNMSNAVSAFTTDLSSLVLNDVGQLTAVDEGNGIGYVLKDRVAGNYGSIGENAKDFSFSDDPLTTKGATGAFSFAEGFNTTASGDYSHAEGFNTVASGSYSHVEGKDTIASGRYSHAEGSSTEASRFISHAEGSNTLASGPNSHAEGFNTTASGTYSHSEGSYTRASGSGSHAEGFKTTASVSGSHAEGFNTEASGSGSHAEGFNTTASGTCSHSEGYKTLATGQYSHVQGYYNYARGIGEHSGGIYGTDYTINNDDTDRLVNYGNGTNDSRDDAFTIYKNGAVRFYRNELSAITNADAGFLIYDSDDNNRPTIHNGTEWKGLAYVDELGGGTTGSTGELIFNGNGYTLKDRDEANYGNVGVNAKDFSFSVSTSNIHGATGDNSFAVGVNTKARGDASHAEGNETRADGAYSHAEGSGSVASGTYSHAEGSSTEADGAYSHAEGNFTEADGAYSHAEGGSTEANGNGSHAEGVVTEANGSASHAEGRSTIASGFASHAEGQNVYARAFAEHSGGAFGTDYTPVNGVGSHPTDRIVNYGNGGDNSNRDDAFTIYRNGAVRFYRTTTSGITNADSGFLIYDSDDNNRPTIHNGTEWKGLAYVDELPNGYRLVSSSDTLEVNDYTLDCDSSGSTITLFDATTTNVQGKVYNVTNSAGGDITVNTISSQTIYVVGGPVTDLTLSDGESIRVQCTGSNWRSL